jgi:hypothetical protein
LILESKNYNECAAKAIDFDLLISVPKKPKESKL